jgi:hypothetical protein
MAATPPAAEPLAGHLLLSSQAFLLLLACSLLLSLAGRLAPCFFAASAAVLYVEAPTLHEKLSSSSPPLVSKHNLAHVPLATQSLYN